MSNKNNTRKSSGKKSQPVLYFLFDKLLARRNDDFDFGNQACGRPVKFDLTHEGAGDILLIEILVPVQLRAGNIAQQLAIITVWNPDFSAADLVIFPAPTRCPTIPAINLVENM